MTVLSAQDQTREEIFGPVAPGRECGGCSECCVHTKIDTPELVKAPGVSCQHRTSQGCAIYQERFPVCRSWQCLWKHIGSMPDEARPDACGVMCVLDQPDEPENVLTRKCIRLIVFDKEKAEKSDLLPSIIAMFQQGDLPVWLDLQNGELSLLHPSKEIAEVVLGEKSNRANKEAAQWLSGVRQKRHGK